MKLEKAWLLPESVPGPDGSLKQGSAGDAAELQMGTILSTE